MTVVMQAERLQIFTFTFVEINQLHWMLSSCLLWISVLSRNRS